MKKALCILLAVLFASLAFTACTGDTQAYIPGTKAKLVKEGTLTVGMEVGYPPMEYLDKDGITKIGFDVELAEKMAGLFGLKLEIVETAWDGIFASLDKGEFDMIISAVSITQDRQEAFILTKPYISNRIVLAVPKDSDGGITSIEDLDGKKVALQSATTAHDYAKEVIAEGKTTFEILPYEKVTQCFSDLKLGRADAVLVDEVVVAGYRDDCKIVWRNTEGEPMGICMKKGNDDLAALVEKAIDICYFDGTMAALSTEYFGSADVVDGVRVVTVKPDLGIKK